MSRHAEVRYVCAEGTFRPVDDSAVRWLDWYDDYPLMREFWLLAGVEMTPDRFLEARALGYTYCAVIQEAKILALAAVWCYSEDIWEVAAVRTREGRRGQGLGKMVVSFATRFVLGEGKAATCTTSEDNTAMRRTAEAVGFVRSDTL